MFKFLLFNSVRGRSEKSVGVITNHCRAHSLTTQKGQFCTVFKLNIFFILKICNKIAADVRVVNNDTNIDKAVDDDNDNNNAPLAGLHAHHLHTTHD